MAETTKKNLNSDAAPDWEEAVADPSAARRYEAEAHKLVGRRIGDFDILRLIATGGMGSVFEARDASRNEVVALKMPHAALSGEKGYITRFYKEAEIASAVEHPNIVRTYSAVEKDQHHFIVMEFVKGRPLTRVIEDEDISLMQALQIARQVASALQEIHRRDIIHRDIKPKNILLEFTGQPKVTDFGIARVTDVGTARPRSRDGEQSRPESEWIGTPVYLAPEQLLSSRADHRSDIYSLGVVLFELITGRTPFTATDPAEIRRLILSAPPPSLTKYDPDIPPLLDQIIEKMLRKKSEERYQSASDLITDLDFAMEMISESEDEPVLSEENLIDQDIRNLGRFHIDGALGRGRLGIVYQARDSRHNRSVALKIVYDHLAREEGFTSRLHREAELASKLSHPNLIRTLESGQLGKRHYIAIEFVSGRKLGTVLREEGKMNAAQAIEVVRLLADGLGALHAVGQLHLNVTPNNIFITEQGAPKLTAFEFSAPRRRETTWDDPFAGGRQSVYYTAPEPWLGIRRDHRADIYSLGVILFELLCGRVPFKGKEQWEILQNVLDSPLPEIHRFHAKVPDGIQEVLEKATAKRAEFRHQKASELAADLEALLRDM